MPFEFAPHLDSRSMPSWTPDRSSVALAVTVTLFKRGGRGFAAIVDYSFDRSGNRYRLSARGHSELPAAARSGGIPPHSMCPVRRIWPANREPCQSSRSRNGLSSRHAANRYPFSSKHLLHSRVAGSKLLFNSSSASLSAIAHAPMPTAREMTTTARPWPVCRRTSKTVPRMKPMMGRSRAVTYPTTTRAPAPRSFV